MLWRNRHEHDKSITTVSKSARVSHDLRRNSIDLAGSEPLPEPGPREGQLSFPYAMRLYGGHHHRYDPHETDSANRYRKHDVDGGSRFAARSRIKGTARQRNAVHHKRRNRQYNTW